MASQKAVPYCEVFSAVIGPMFRCSSRSSVIARHTSPRPNFAMKLMTSGVTCSAAIVRSPSFSRSSSSTTMIMRPSRKAATASSIEANDALRFVALFPFCFIAFPVFPPSRLRADFHRPEDVLPEHVALQIDRVVHLGRLQVRMLPRERDDLHVQ